MKRFLGVMAVLLVFMAGVAGAQTGTPDTDWYTANPDATSFTISTADELAGLSLIVNGFNSDWIYTGSNPTDDFSGKTIKLTKDIDLSVYAEWTGTGWMRIGTRESGQFNRPFSGNFDGGGFVIRNLTINRPNRDNEGLFGYVWNGTVKNLGVENVNITARYWVGGVVGYLGATSTASFDRSIVDNCYSTGTVNGNESVGGVVGIIAASSIINSHSTATVSGTYRYVGGVLGGGGTGLLTGCYSTGTVSGRTFVGGVVGHSNGVRISGSYSTGMVIGISTTNNNVTTGGSYIGGVVGSGGSVTDCYFTGEVSGRDTVGGVAGMLRGRMTNSYSTGKVTGTYRYIGGLVGEGDMGSGKIFNSYSTGNVSGTDFVGGVIGSLEDSVVNSYSTGKISGTDVVGGVAGVVRNGKGTVINSYTTSEVSGRRNVGGVAGSVGTGGRITNSYSTGTVTGTGNNVGGVAGFVSGGYGISHVTNSYSTGAVSGIDTVGGVVGRLQNESILTDCAALNTQVKGNSSVGRIVGSNSIIAGGNFSNNTAYAGMTNSANNTTWNNKGIDDLDGADISISAIRADGTIGERFTSEGGWTLEPGWLLTLGGEQVTLPSFHAGPVSVKFTQRQRQSTKTAPAQFINISGRTLHLNLPERGKVDIYTLNGAKLRSLDFAQGNHTYRLNDLPRGMYVVRATSGAWKQSVRMAVK